MKRRTGRPLLKLGDNITVIHFNVGSGYVTYLEKLAGEAKPRLHSVLLSKTL